ncbi:MAG: PAS domain S-box protein [Hylemonella sp.]|nr:PAS domain S-box protein [Hylemonella sp.]
MELQLAVRRYLLVSATLFVLGLLGLAYALVGQKFGNLLTREVLLAAGLSLSLAGGWQFWALAITQYRADRQSDALASQLEMMAAVAQHTGNAVIVTNGRHEVAWVNESFCRVTGYAEGEVLGQQPGGLLRSPAADPDVLARLDEAIRNHAGIDVEVLHRYRDGRDRWVRMLLSPQRDAEDSFTGFVAVLVDVDAQVLTREALRKALSDNQSLMRTLDEQAFVSETDRDGTITRVNRRFAQISGYTESELLGQNHRLLNSRVHPPQFWAEMWDSIRRGESRSEEICNRAKDGQLYWLHSLIVPFVGPDGEVERYVTMSLDVTARKQVEEQLRTSQQLLTRTSRIAGIGSWHADLRTSELHLSDECRAILRLPATQDNHIDDIWRRFDPEASARAREQLLAMTRLERLSVDLVARMPGAEPGQALWVRLVAEMDWHGAQTERIIGAVQDITAQVGAQQRIEEEQRILRGAIEALGEAFVLFDPDDRLVYCNDKYRQLYVPIQDEIHVGAAYEKIVRAAADAGIFKHSQDDKEASVQEALSLHRMPYSDRIRELHDGRWLRIIEGLTADNYHVGYRIDVTALQNALMAADAASRSKGQFLANMSHEIRTPLNAVLGLLQLLRYTSLTSEQGELVHKTHTAARSLLGILNDILDYSKVEAGKMELQPEPFAVGQLLQDLSVILSGALGEKRLELLYEIDPRIPPVLMGDALRLKQVLINLGGNAIKFTATGQVRMGLSLVRRDNDKVRIRFSVQDTGIGISPEQRQHIFSGFSQAEASIARRFGGTGLGLAISRRLVALMQGEITLDSTPGAGSVFAFEVDFPVAAMAVPPRLAPGDCAHPAAAPRLSGLRLLLAEDNALNQEVALAMLEREGAQVVVAGNGQQAVDRLAAQPQGFDLVLMDVQMPVLDGLQATQQIRQRLQLRELPILAMTANAMSADREACAAAGMNAHVGKPFELDELVALIRQHTGRAAEAVAGGRVSEPADAGAGASVLDTATALRRLGQDTALLQRLRSAFVPATAELMRQTRQAAAHGDWSAAGGWAHQLKSSAASVGAEELAQAGAVAEQHWRTSAAVADAAKSAELLVALDAAWGRAQGALVQVPAATPVSVPQVVESSPGSLLDRLVQLEALLQQSDMAAIDLHEALLERHAQLPELAALNLAMERLDLPAAAGEAARLIRQLQERAAESGNGA